MRPPRLLSRRVARLLRLDRHDPRRWLLRYSSQRSYGIDSCVLDLAVQNGDPDLFTVCGYRGESLDSGGCGVLRNDAGRDGIDPQVRRIEVTRANSWANRPCEPTDAGYASAAFEPHPLNRAASAAAVLAGMLHSERTTRAATLPTIGAIHQNGMSSDAGRRGRHGINAGKRTRHVFGKAIRIDGFVAATRSRHDGNRILDCGAGPGDGLCVDCQSRPQSARPHRWMDLDRIDLNHG